VKSMRPQPISRLRFLSVVPPICEPNSHYPSTTYLTGFLRARGWTASQADASLLLLLRIFSRQGLLRIVEALRGRYPVPGGTGTPNSVRLLMAQSDRFVERCELAVRFLQGHEPGLAARIAGGAFLPRGSYSRFAAQCDHHLGVERLRRLTARHEEPAAQEAHLAVQPDALTWLFGSAGIHDRAAYVATGFLRDVECAIRDGLDSRFHLESFGLEAAQMAADFGTFARALQHRTILDDMMEDVLDDALIEHQPDVLGFTVPFGGNLYGAFRLAAEAKRFSPGITTVAGGGFVSCCLREVSNPDVFDYFDYIVLDDGEQPLLCLLEFLSGRRERNNLLRTYCRRDGQVELISTPRERDIRPGVAPAPTAQGLPIDRYIGLHTPIPGPWARDKANKLTVAHGCYWGKCTFCDTGLDYIGRYDPAPAEAIVDRIEALISENSIRLFHFVDEAAPPRLLGQVAEALLRRRVAITWWSNIRFERAFTPNLVSLLAESGCVCVSGGLEVASDRLLALMSKGTTVADVARTTGHFRDARVAVHAYLMYGYPGQTAQEIIDSLECVRQLFVARCLASGFWHRFVPTKYSPIGRKPWDHGLQLTPRAKPDFVDYALPFETSETGGVNYGAFGPGLEAALRCYINDVGVDLEVRRWFAFKVPPPSIPSDMIERLVGDATLTKDERSASVGRT